MIHMRGQASDYDLWAQAAGDERWLWGGSDRPGETLAIYKQMEDYFGGADAWHGAGGPLNVMDLRSRSTTRITTDPSIDTSPSFSPDGTKIAFNSDRGGQAQLYVMNTDGSGVRRISYGGGRYTTPVWSPRGDFIAFTKQTGGEFHIGVMRPDGSDERLLTTSYLDEGPRDAG